MPSAYEDLRAQIAGQAMQAIPAAIELTASRLGAPMVRRDRGAGPMEYPEPWAGLLIARQLEYVAGQWARNYIRDLREANVSWRQVGQLIGLDETAAFAAATAEPWLDSDSNSWREDGTFGWRCTACRRLIADYGPAVGTEAGHDDGCSRLTRGDENG